jgi:hypothetical protein
MARNSPRELPRTLGAPRGLARASGRRVAGLCDRRDDRAHLLEQLAYARELLVREPREVGGREQARALGFGRLDGHPPRRLAVRRSKIAIHAATRTPSGCPTRITSTSVRMADSALVRARSRTSAKMRGRPRGLPDRCGMKPLPVAPPS